MALVQKQRRKERMGSYNSYLWYKMVIAEFRKGPLSRIDLARALNVETPSVWHVVRVLIKNRVLKIDHYDITTGGKKAVYLLIKDE